MFNLAKAYDGTWKFQGSKSPVAQPDKQRAVELYRQAANLGHRQAANDLGAMYVLINAELFLLLCYLSCLVLSSLVLFVLLFFLLFLFFGSASYFLLRNVYRYYHGDGVERSGTEAAKWYRKSGVPMALNSLGLLYIEGFGVQRSEEEARRLFRVYITLYIYILSM